VLADYVALQPNTKLPQNNPTEINTSYVCLGKILQENLKQEFPSVACVPWIFLVELTVAHIIGEMIRAGGRASRI